MPMSIFSSIFSSIFPAQRYLAHVPMLIPGMQRYTYSYLLKIVEIEKGLKEKMVAPMEEYGN